MLCFHGLSLTVPLVVRFEAPFVALALRTRWSTRQLPRRRNLSSNINLSRDLRFQDLAGPLSWYRRQPFLYLLWALSKRILSSNGEPESSASSSLPPLRMPRILARGDVILRLRFWRIFQASLDRVEICLLETRRFMPIDACLSSTTVGVSSSSVVTSHIC
ncbi:hypothetical protein EV363DRAFT_242382 [Boletus edulis]|nr:hypothetical protein EV363DRAFT_242382 [Boletus edulis]